MRISETLQNLINQHTKQSYRVAKSNSSADKPKHLKLKNMKKDKNYFLVA